MESTYLFHSWIPPHYSAILPHTLSCREQQEKKDEMARYKSLKKIWNCQNDSRSIALDELQLCIEAKSYPQYHCIDSLGPESRPCQKARLSSFFSLFTESNLSRKWSGSRIAKVRTSVQNTSKGMFFLKSQCQFFRQCSKKHEIEVLKKIQETQDELVSEAEHRIKKFDDFHA